MSEHNRGQSELVGYLLVFSVVVLTIALMGTTGFVGLNGAQDFQRTTNVQHGFSALADDIDDVARDDAPSRTTAIGLADASLSVDNQTQIAVTVSNGSENATVQTRAIVYDSGSETRISYSGGALIREDQGSAVMYREPRFVFTNRTVILPIVVTSATDDASVGGSTAVAIETTSQGTELLTAEDVGTVTVEVTSPHAGAWHRYLDDEMDCEDPTDQTVECDIDTERVVIAIEHVDVQFR